MTLIVIISAFWMIIFYEERMGGKQLLGTYYDQFIWSWGIFMTGGLLWFAYGIYKCIPKTTNPDEIRRRIMMRVYFISLGLIFFSWMTWAKTGALLFVQFTMGWGVIGMLSFVILEGIHTNNPERFNSLFPLPATPIMVKKLNNRFIYWVMGITLTNYIIQEYSRPFLLFLLGELRKMLI